MLNLSIENFGGTSDGFCYGPSQWFLPITVREGDTFESVQWVIGSTSTCAGANHLSNKVLAPRELEGISIQTEGCRVPVDGAMLSRQRACLPRAGAQQTHQVLLQLLDFRVVYPCGISPLSTAFTTRGYGNAGHPWRYVQKDTTCTWTDMARGFVGYRHTPTAPKIGARTGAIVTTKSSTSVNVRSALCCGIGNPAVSHGF